MKNFLLALQFLTIIPIKIKSVNEKEVAASLAYFPIAGMFIGLALAAIFALFGLLGFPLLAADIIVVVALIALTGGMHLDGLADTADAYLSARDRDEMLRIMRDPHTGVMGILAVISILLLKISFLFAIRPSLMPLALVLMCAISRWSLVFSLFAFPYARESGKAKIFKEGINRKIFILATAATLAAVLILGKLTGLLTWGTAAFGAYLADRLINKKIGGLTGDTLGAINELTEAGVLFYLAVLGGARL